MPLYVWDNSLNAMDLLTGIGGFGESLWGYLIPFLFVLTVVVFHELGHFTVARWCGVKVDVFSIGFGTGNFRLERQARHAVETELDTSWRVREIRGRRERSQRPGQAAPR